MPGRHEPSCTAYLGHGRSLLTVFHVKHRYTSPGGSTAVEIVRPFVAEAKIVSWLDAIGLVGPCGIQFKIDERTREPKLIEANARLGQNTRMILPMLAKWGVDPGRLLMDSYTGVQRSPARIPVGTIGLSPLDDIASLVLLLRSRALPRRADNPLPSVPEFVAGVARTYRGRRIAWDILFSSLLRDPQAIVSVFAHQLGSTKNPPTVPWSGTRARGPLIDVARLYD